MKEQIEAVQRMQDYIESHWQESITLADLSKASHFSPWYSARLFRKLTGLSPADYIRRYKLSRSGCGTRTAKSLMLLLIWDSEAWTDTRGHFSVNSAVIPVNTPLIPFPCI